VRVEPVVLAERSVRWSTLVCLWVAAAGYFLLGFTEGMEQVDEGHLVYLSWRVSEGALPYRAFQHWYGPSVFFLNGLLFDLAGPDLLVVRSAILILRACLAVSVFLLTRALAGTVPAVLAYGLTVAIWGTPLWIFNAPYATNYQLPLTLVGLAAYLLLPGAPRVRLLVAGICFGLGATFRQTGGGLAFVGMVLFLLSRKDGTETASRLDPSWLAWRAMRVAVIVAALCVLGVYGATFGNLWEVALLVLPTVVLSLWVLTQGRDARRQDVVQNLSDVASMTTGFAIAPLGYAVWYAAQGALAALVRAVVFGLPQQFALFVRFPTPDRRALLFLGVAAMGLGHLRACRATGAHARALRVAALTGLALAAGLLLHDIATTPGIRTYLGHGAWSRDLSQLLFWLPPITVWATCIALMRSQAAEKPEALGAVTFVASASLPALAPVADWAHVLMILPLFLPLAAYDLRAIWGPDETRGPAAPPGRLCGGVFIGAWLIAVTTPFVRALAATRLDSTGRAVTFARATYITDRSPDARHLYDLVQYVESRLGKDDRFLVLPSNGMVYFLTGRASALEDDEFGFYAGAFGPQLSERDARALVDQRDAIRRLDRQRPLIVRVRDTRAEQAFRRVFPRLSRYIDRRYQGVAAFGPYEVLEWLPGTTSPRPGTPGTAAP